MNGEADARRTLDVAALPPMAFGNQGLIWWGTVGFMVIEGSMFVIGLVVYFYLRLQVRDWPPSLPNPGLRFGTWNLLVVLASCVPNLFAKKAAEKFDLAGVRAWLGVLVLMTASLLVRSLRNLQEVDLGYSRDQLLLVRVDILQSGYKGAAIQNITRELLDRLSALPGVRSATASSNGLFSGDESSDAILVDGVDYSARQSNGNVTADDEVGPNYFSTIGVPIVLGREITQQDFLTAAHVAVVNEAFAKFYFGDRDPIGRQISIQDSDHPNQPPYEIVGVAHDVHELGPRQRRRQERDHEAVLRVLLAEAPSAVERREQQGRVGEPEHRSGPSLAP